MYVMENVLTIPSLVMVLANMQTITNVTLGTNATGTGTIVTKYYSVMMDQTKEA